MEFELFTRVTDGLPRITCLEPGWELMEPDDDYPFALIVHVAFEGDSESGVPESEGQLEALEAMAQTLAEALSKHADARFVAADTSDSMHSIHFRLPRGRAPGPAINEAMKKLKAKAERVECFEDPDWESVFDDLLPDSVEVATSDATMLMWSLEDEGHDLSKPRPVRHAILLPDQARFEAFTAWAQARGYTVTQGESIDEVGFHVHAVRTEAVEQDAALDEIEAMVEQTLELDGTYVEWDCTGEA